MVEREREREGESQSERDERVVKGDILLERTTTTTTMVVWPFFVVNENHFLL